MGGGETHSGSQSTKSAAAAPPAQVIAVGGGKGGVGKTALVTNLAIALAGHRRRVLALDGDLGLANLDIAFGVNAEKSLLDVLDGSASIQDIVIDTGMGVSILPGCSGRFDLANLSQHERHGLFTAVDLLESDFDILLIDTGAGVNSNSVDFAAAAQRVIVVANNEPTSLADAYGYMKVLHGRCGIKEFDLVANAVRSVAEGEEVYRRLSGLAGRFLGVGVKYLGMVFQDHAVHRSICNGSPLMISEPKSSAAGCIDTIARKIIQNPQASVQSGGIQLFWKRLVGWKAAA